MDRQYLLALAAERAADRPRYFAWVLRRYADAESLSPEALADRLNMTPDGLVGLSLCFRPRAETFAADLKAVAIRYGADLGILAGLVRQVEALDALAEGRPASAERGWLLAARQRPGRETKPAPKTESKASPDQPEPPRQARKAGDAEDVP